MAVAHTPMGSSAESLSSRKAKHRSDKHRLLRAELLHLYPDLQMPALDEDSNSSHSKGTTNPSHRHSESQPRSHPSRRSHDSISSILLMTTEKLHNETSRANAAERHIADVMSLFKNAHDQKQKLERELVRVREELGLYKIQLNVAQKEIFRAQETVERIDRQRVEAEESAVRAREKSRKLAEARAVDRAIEEGRRLGFEEGLNQGRIMSQVEKSERNRKESSGSSSATPRSRKSRSTARPTPKDLPTATRPRSVSSRPEEITIQTTTARPRSMSVRNQSPVVASRRSVVLPPDNYIPVLNADATITLPPPHELNMPLPTEAGRSDQRDDRQTYPERPTKGKSVPSTSYRGRMTPPSPTPRRDPPDSERIVPYEALGQAHETHSPATYPDRPPLRRREIVLPIPLGHQGPTSTASNQGSAQNGSTPNITTSLRPFRTTSNTSIPGIEVETPSTKSPSSDKTAYDPVLLTPEQPSKPVALPSQPQEEHTSGAVSPFDPKDAITGVLPDNNLPHGFVPLSPIADMANLNPYPPGFGPGLQPAEQSAPLRSDTFVYPASPLARSQ